MMRYINSHYITLHYFTVNAGAWCKCRGKRDDIDEEDIQESYFRYMEENPTAGLIQDDDDNIEYDEDGNAIIPDKKVSSVVVYLCAVVFSYVTLCKQLFG